MCKVIGGNRPLLLFSQGKPALPIETQSEKAEKTRILMAVRCIGVLGLSNQAGLVNLKARCRVFSRLQLTDQDMIRIERLRYARFNSYPRDLVPQVFEFPSLEFNRIKQSSIRWRRACYPIFNFHQCARFSAIVGANENGNGRKVKV